MIELSKVETSFEVMRKIKERATPKGIAEISKLTGISRPQLYDIFSGKSVPRLDTLIKLTKALKLEILIG